MTNISMKECPIKQKNCIGFGCAWWSSRDDRCFIQYCENASKTLLYLYDDMSVTIGEIKELVVEAKDGFYINSKRLESIEEELRKFNSRCAEEINNV